MADVVVVGKAISLSFSSPPEGAEPTLLKEVGVQAAAHSS